MKTKTTLYFLIILNSLTLFSCNKDSDITVLNNRINELVDVIEEHKLSNVSDYLAKDFVAEKNLNKSQFLLFTHLHLQRNKNISIVIFSKELIANKDYFDVIFQVLLLGSDSLFPERGQKYNVASKWNKEGGKWVLSRLRWDKI